MNHPIFELLKFFKIKYKIIYLLSILSSIFEVIAFGLLGFLIVNFKDLNFKNINFFNYINLDYSSLPILIILSFFFKIIFQILNNYLISSKAWEMRNEVSNFLIKKFVFLNYLTLIKKHSGYIMNIINIECTRSANFINFYFLLISKIISMIVMVIFLLVYNLKYTIVLLLINVILFLIFKNKIYSFSNNIGNLRLLYAKNHTIKLSDIIDSIEEAKIWNFENILVNDYYDVGSKVSEINRKYQFYPSLIVPLIEFFLILLSFTFFIFAYKNNFFNINFIGSFIIFLIISIRLFQSLSAIVTILMKFRSIQASIVFLLKEIKEKNITISNNDKENVNGKIVNIEAKNISFHYEGNKKILDNASIEFKKNTINAIIGNSGEGKSTFLNILTGLINQYHGELIINQNINLSTINIKSYQSKIAYVTQKPYILNDTIENNITFNSKIFDKEKFNRAVKFANVDQFVNKIDSKFKTILDQNGKNLSIGQLQRISLARAFYRNPDIYLFDESTSALDKDTQNKILDNIKLLKKDSIVIIVSHRLEVLSIADNIFEIKNKKFIKINDKD